MWAHRLGHLIRSLLERLLWIIASSSYGCVKLKTNLCWSTVWSDECLSSGSFFDSYRNTRTICAFRSRLIWSWDCHTPGPWSGTSSNRVAWASKEQLYLAAVVTRGSESQRSRWKVTPNSLVEEAEAAFSFNLCLLGWHLCSPAVSGYRVSFPPASECALRADVGSI